MALPLDPQTDRLFDVEAVEPFVEAPELAELSEAVMARFSEFRPIDEAVRDTELQITYVWETKPWDDKEELKPHTIAKVTKASPLWRCIARTHVVMQFRQWFWNRLSAEQREAVVYHELSHIEVDHDDEGDLRLKLREHDLEEFAGVMRRFGAIVPGRRAFINAYLAWQDEQEGREPVQLRSVDPEFIDQVMDHAVEAVNAGALGPNVTASRGVGEQAAHLDGDEDVPRGTPDPEPEALDLGGCPFPGCVLAAEHEGGHSFPPAASDVDDDLLPF